MPTPKSPPKPPFLTIRDALLQSAKEFADYLTSEKLDSKGRLSQIEGRLGELAAAYLTAEATRMLEVQTQYLLVMTRRLVVLTWVLVGTSAILAVLTTALLLRSV